MCAGDTIGTVPSVSFLRKQKVGQLCCPAFLFENDTEGTVPIVSLDAVTLESVLSFPVSSLVSLELQNYHSLGKVLVLV